MNNANTIKDKSAIQSLIDRFDDQLHQFSASCDRLGNLSRLMEQETPSSQPEDAKKESKPFEDGLLNDLDSQLKTLQNHNSNLAYYVSRLEKYI